MVLAEGFLSKAENTFHVGSSQQKPVDSIREKCCAKSTKNCLQSIKRINVFKL